MRKEAADTARAALTWLGGGRLRLFLTKPPALAAPSSKGCRHLQGAWITPQKSCQMGKVCVNQITAAAWLLALAGLHGAHKGQCLGLQEKPWMRGAGDGTCPEATLASLSLKAPNTAPLARTSSESTE